jgi:hypothetical protein
MVSRRGGDTLAGGCKKSPSWSAASAMRSLLGMDLALVYAAPTAMVEGVRELDYYRPSSTSIATTPREDGLLSLTFLLWMKDGLKVEKFLTLLGSWH